jgi:hypothetical protein
MWRIELRALIQGQMSVDAYGNKLKALIKRVDVNNNMPDEEKVAIVIAGAAPIYKPFLYASNPNNLDAALTTMRNIETGARADMAANGTNALLTAKVNELEAQVNALNTNPSYDRRMNPHRNEPRFNRDQRQQERRNNFTDQEICLK